MPDVEAPEVEIDDDAPQFRRRLAVVVVLITLFAAGVAYLHEQNSNFEDNASREAQLSSIRAFGHQVDALTESALQYDVFVQKELLQRRLVVANARLRATTDPGQDALYSGEGNRYAQLRDAVGGETSVQDLNGATQLDSQLQTVPDREHLRQIAFASKANDYGGKADSYVAVLTVLAVGLFLIGLSLTVTGRGRYLLAAPGVAIAIICVAWAIVITAGDITRVSDNAINLTVDGQRLASSSDPKAAVEKYRAAVDDSPEFATAWGRLADAEFESGLDLTSQNAFQSIADRDATLRAIEAGERAISLGESDPSELSSIGFYHFTVGEFDRAEVLSRQALEGNDRFPPLVFNLGVAQVAKGEADAARATYDRGLELLGDGSFDDDLRIQILAAARTDLDIAASLVGDQADLVQEMKGLLAQQEAPLLGGDDVALPERAPDDSAVTDVAITTDAFRFVATYNTEGYDPNTALLNVWYFRPLQRNGEGPFDQVFSLNTVTVTGQTPAVVTVPRENGSCLPGGDYRVEVYAGRDMVGSAETHLEDSPLGTLLVEGGDEVGFTFCRPDSWSAEETEQQGTLSFRNPDDPAQSVTVFTVPFGNSPGVDPNTVLDATLTEVVSSEQIQGTPPEAAEEFLGRTVEGSDVLLPTLTVQGAGPDGEVRITGSVGSDNVVRFVVLTANNGDDMETLRSELVNSVRFLRVPDTTTPSGG